MAVGTHGEQLLKSYDCTGRFDLWIKLLFLRLVVEVPGLEEGEGKQDKKYRRHKKWVI